MASQVGKPNPAFEVLVHNECIIQNTTQLKSFLGRGEGFSFFPFKRIVICHSSYTTHFLIYYVVDEEMIY